MVQWTNSRPYQRAEADSCSVDVGIHNRGIATARFPVVAIESSITGGHFTQYADWGTVGGVVALVLGGDSETFASDAPIHAGATSHCCSYRLPPANVHGQVRLRLSMLADNNPPLVSAVEFSRDELRDGVLKWGGSEEMQI